MATKSDSRVKKSKDKGKALKEGKKGEPGSQPSVSGRGLSRKFDFLPSWWPVPVFMLVGLFFRLSTTLWEPLIYPDSLQYMDLAREIRSGVFFQKDYDLDQGFIKSRRLPPLYSFLLAPFAGTPADLEIVGHLTSLLMSALTFIPLYFGMILIFSRRAAILSCALFCFQPFALFYASPILTEATFTFLYAVVITLSAWALARPGLALFAAGGALSALLYMTRDVGITAMPLIGLGALVKLRFIDRREWKGVAALIGVMAGCFLLVSFPYFLHIRVRTGQWGLSTQMSNSGITRQIQLEGGDRYDRDRLKGVEVQLVDEKEAGSAMGLIKLAPALAHKLIRNMDLYGAEAERRFGPFLFVFLLISLWAMLNDYLRGKNREKFFREMWVPLWIVQLWTLYSLVTPYMVDDRYMYPLLVPGLMMAGHGLNTVLEIMPRLAREREPENRPFAVIAAVTTLLLAVIYLWKLPLLVYSDSVKEVAGSYPESSAWVPLSQLLGAAAIFFLAAMPGTRLFFGKKIPGPAAPGFFPVMGIFLMAAGILAAAAPHPLSQYLGRIADDSPPGSLYLKCLPGLLLLGAGGGFVSLPVLARVQQPAQRAGIAAAAMLVMVAMLTQGPDYIDIHHRRSPDSLSTKYASGHRQAARDILAKKLVPPGKIICERKPFMTYYLDGRFYMSADNEPIPKTVSEVEKLAASGAIDFLVADSFTFKALRPHLTGLAFALNPLPGASVVYSRYFPQYDRIITLYNCRRSEPPLADNRPAPEHLAAAQQYVREANLIFAYRELTKALELDPGLKDAWALKIKILFGYYQLATRPKTPTLVIAPDLLPALLETAKGFAGHFPEDKAAIEDLKQANRLYQDEIKMIEEYRRKIEADSGNKQGQGDQGPG